MYSAFQKPCPLMARYTPSSLLMSYLFMSYLFMSYLLLPYYLLLLLAPAEMAAFIAEAIW